MKKIVKKKAPSRIRYEQSHPTVSCRVSKELYDRLRKVNEKEERSFADILKVGLGIIEVKVAKEEEMRKVGYDQGYKKGYADARAMYEVSYACCVCKGIITVTSQEAKTAIKAYMEEERWGHGNCIDKG